MFTACAVVDQRLLVLQRPRQYTLNAITTPTYNTILTGVAGFIALALKAKQHFPSRRLVPSAVGEWVNECLHSALRDPNCQTTSNVSAAQCVQRLGKVLGEHQFKRSAGWNSVASSSNHQQHINHPPDHPSYSDLPSRKEVHDSMALGQAMWRQVRVGL